MVGVKIFGVVAALLLVSLGFNTADLLEQNANYYCEDRNIVMHCELLSSTGKTCYTQVNDDGTGIRTGSKSCSTLWKYIEYNQPPIPDDPNPTPTPPIELVSGDLPTLQRGEWCYPEGRLENKVLCNEIQ